MHNIHSTRWWRFAALLGALALFVAACGGSDDTTNTADAETEDSAPEVADTEETTPEAEPEVEDEDEDEGVDEEPDLDVDEGPTVLNVPADFSTIQDAVDNAQPGNLIMIAEGVYNEAVAVETDNLVIRGADRNATILDGQFELENGLIIFSNGVAVENLTARNYTSNGVFWTGDYDSDIILEGYRASYVTAHNNGNYGIYAFNASYGLIEHSYGSGHPDSAFYIGQCKPCNAMITDSIGENNALGYSGTNASGNLHIVNNEFMGNRIGVVPNTLSTEELGPQGDAVFAGNYVHDNGNAVTPRKGSDWDLAFGVGIVVAGGNDNLVTKNLVTDNTNGGVAVSLFFDDGGIFTTSGNTVSDNVISGSLYDLLLVGEAADGNCFAGNTFATSRPVDLEVVAGCGTEAQPLVDVLDPLGDPLPVPAEEPADYKDIVVPAAQPSMPDADTAEAVAADVIERLDAFDLASVTLPQP